MAAAPREPARHSEGDRPRLRVVGPDDIAPVEHLPSWRRVLYEAARRPRRVVLWGLVSLVFLLGLSTYMAKRNAEASLLSFRSNLDLVRASLTSLDHAGARQALAAARDDLTQAGRARRAVGVRLLAATPGLRNAIGSYDSFLIASEHLYESADRATGVVELVGGGPDRPPLLADGRVDFAVLARAREETMAGLAALDRAGDAVAEVRSFPFLEGISRAKSEAATEIARAQHDSRAIPDLLAKLPVMLGSEGPRAYFFAIQNSAELRGSGGGLLSFVIVRADAGRIEIVRDQSTSIYEIDIETPDDRRVYEFDWPADDFWTRHLAANRRIGNVNWSPHFPTVGHNVAQLYTLQSGGEVVDGVIAVTPEFLARVMKVTGPVTVAGVADPLTAETVVRYVIHDAYRIYLEDRETRRAINAALVDEVARRLLAGGDFGALVRELGGSVQTRALQVYMTRGDEQQVISDLGLDGALTRTEADYGSFVAQNTAGNKADYFIRHEVRHDVTIDPQGSSHDVVSNVMRNTAPPNPGPPGTRLNEYLDGYGDRYIAAYLPGRAVVEREQLVFNGPMAAELNGELPSDLPRSEREAGRLVSVRRVRIIPQTEGTFEIRYRLPGAATRGPDGVWTYTLVRQRQPRLDPDVVTVSVALPRGARAIDPAGWERDDQGRWVSRTEVTGTTTFILRYTLPS